MTSTLTPPSAPKRARTVGWPPRFHTAVSAADVKRGDGAQVTDAIETLCVTTKASHAGPAHEPVTLRPWQRRLTGDIFARTPDGRLRHRVALVGVPRKNGKSTLAAGYALEGLVFGEPGTEVYSCAGDPDQAKIVFGTAKAMVEASPELSAVCRPYRDVIEVVESGAIFRALSSEAATKEGYNPSRVIFDEVHVQPNDELWEVMRLGMGARVDPLIIAITTAGKRGDSRGHDSLCYRLWQYGCAVASGELEDPTFFFAWWGAPDGANHRDPGVWKRANPSYGDIIDPADFASVLRTSPENEFRTKRMNQWVSSATAWLPHGAWETCEEKGASIPDGSRVVLAFDGSFTNDSTGLVACSVPAEGELPLLEVAGVWEKPGETAVGWQVPILEVEQAIRDACERYAVSEIACDPSGWRRSLELLQSEGFPVVEFPQTDARMIPATTRFYQSVVNRTLRHNGDPRLARHVANTTTALGPRGTRIRKESKSSERKIDLTVCAVMALDRAVNQPVRRKARMVFAGNVVQRSPW